MRMERKHLMYKISLVLKKRNNFIVRKDYFSNDYFYGFFELCEMKEIDISNICDFINSNYPSFNGADLEDISYVTKVENPETVYVFCIAYTDSELAYEKELYHEVSEEELKTLNMIYPDAICRDILSKQDKPMSVQEKEILIAADKIFNINENAARADAFIALMENRIDERGFESFIKERIKAYSYGMPDFGFTTDMQLCIWKGKEDRWNHQY